MHICIKVRQKTVDQFDSISTACACVSLNRWISSRRHRLLTDKDGLGACNKVMAEVQSSWRPCCKRIVARIPALRPYGFIVVSFTAMESGLFHRAIDSIAATTWSLYAY